jgi:LytS/YehU family sensor histidine kinase
MLDNDKENASRYLSKFSRLMRLILENSRQQEVPLEKDLAALELYLQLESLRFNNRFKYTIEVDSDIDSENTLIPPMLLQPFVENSIIHGLSYKKDGLIKVKVHRENNEIKCVVEDNGIGRKKAVLPVRDEDKKREGFGIKITEERLQIINQQKKVKSAIRILDIEGKDNEPGGLRIELSLPYEQAF